MSAKQKVHYLFPNNKTPISANEIPKGVGNSWGSHLYNDSELTPLSILLWGEIRRTEEEDLPSSIPILEKTFVNSATPNEIKISLELLIDKGLLFLKTSKRPGKRAWVTPERMKKIDSKNSKLVIPIQLLESSDLQSDILVYNVIKEYTTNGFFYSSISNLHDILLEDYPNLTKHLTIDLLVLRLESLTQSQILYVNNIPLWDVFNTDLNEELFLVLIK